MKRMKVDLISSRITWGSKRMRGKRGGKFQTKYLTEIVVDQLCDDLEMTLRDFARLGDVQIVPEKEGRILLETPVLEGES